MTFDKKLLCIILLMVSIVSYAQVPGYLGKRKLLGYNCSVTPVFIYSAFLNQDAYNFNGSKMNPTTGVQLKHELAYDWVIKERASIRMALGSTFVGIEGENPEIEYISFPPFFIPIPNTRYCKYTKLHTMEFKLGYISYPEGFIAPAGFHYGYGIQVVNANYHSIYSDNNNKKVRQTGGGIFFEAGKRRIFKDKFYTDVGFSLNLVFPLYPPPAVETNNNSRLSPLTYNGIFNVKLGGGILF